MPTVLRSDLFNVVLACRARLMLRLEWPAERVLVADPEQYEYHPQADQYLTLWLADQGSPDMPVFEGGGRFDTRMAVRLAVTLYTRLSVDEAPSSLAALTDTSLGHLNAAGAVLNALVGFTPTDTADDSGNWYCTQGVNPAPVSAPRRPRRKTGRAAGDGDPDWTVSTLGFVAVYELNLNQSQG